MSMELAWVRTETSPNGKSETEPPGKDDSRGFRWGAAKRHHRQEVVRRMAEAGAWKLPLWQPKMALLTQLLTKLEGRKHPVQSLWETLGHILSKCETQAWKLHKIRHNRVLVAW